MKRVLTMVMFLGATVSLANVQSVELSGDRARSLFNALIQADLKTIDTPLRDVVYPDVSPILIQKVLVRALRCDMAYAQTGVLLGSCTGSDVDGKFVKLGSAAAAQIVKALPDGFMNATNGRFHVSAASITCELNTHQNEPEGVATTTCFLQ